MNVAWPMPPQGAFLMYPSAYERFSCDMVMMIELQHYLDLKQGIKFEALSAMAERYRAKHLIIEWVPPDDPTVADWLTRGSLGHVPDWYTETGFENAMRANFPVMTRLPGPASRTMYLVPVSQDRLSNTKAYRQGKGDRSTRIRPDNPQSHRVARQDECIGFR
jgi:hypothetical protein